MTCLIQTRLHGKQCILYQDKAHYAKADAVKQNKRVLTANCEEITALARLELIVGDKFIFSGFFF